MCHVRVYSAWRTAYPLSTFLERSLHCACAPEGEAASRRTSPLSKGGGHASCVRLSEGVFECMYHFFSVQMGPVQSEVMSTTRERRRTCICISIPGCYVGRVAADDSANDAAADTRGASGRRHQGPCTTHQMLLPIHVAVNPRMDSGSTETSTDVAYAYGGSVQYNSSSV